MMLGGNTLEANSYKIKVTPKDADGNSITKGILRYKEYTDRYWETVDGFEFIVYNFTNVTKYDVTFEESNGSIAQAQITKNSMGKPIVKQITD